LDKGEKDAHCNTGLNLLTVSVGRSKVEKEEREKEGKKDRKKRKEERKFESIGR
jgi:hypothetical protein